MHSSSRAKTSPIESSSRSGQKIASGSTRSGPETNNSEDEKEEEEEEEDSFVTRGRQRVLESSSESSSEDEPTGIEQALNSTRKADARQKKTSQGKKIAKKATNSDLKDRLRLADEKSRMMQQVGIKLIWSSDIQQL